MKKFYILTILLASTLCITAQPPQSFTYQAIVRNTDGTVIENTTIGMRISILESTATGIAVCVEEFAPTSNDYGLVSLEIGTDNPTDFKAIDWSADDYFVKVEIDPAGGTSYVEMGTSQLLSVPYALHAAVADSVPITGNEPAFDGWDKSVQEIWTQSGNNVYYTEGNVGIGGANAMRPAANLHVDGSAKIGTTNAVVFQEIRHFATTTHATNDWVSVSLPSGYNETNTRVLNLEINYLGDRWVSFGFDGAGGGDAVSCLMNESTLYIYYPDETNLKNKAVRILLMRID